MAPRQSALGQLVLAEAPQLAVLVLKARAGRTECDTRSDFTNGAPSLNVAEAVGSPASTALTATPPAEVSTKAAEQ